MRGQSVVNKLMSAFYVLDSLFLLIYDNILNKNIDGARTQFFLSHLSFFFFFLIYFHVKLKKIENLMKKCWSITIKEKTYEN